MAATDPGYMDRPVKKAPWWRPTTRLGWLIVVLIIIAIGALVWEGMKIQEREEAQTASKMTEKKAPPAATGASASTKPPASAIVPGPAASAAAPAASDKVGAIVPVSAASQPKAPASKPATAKKKENKDAKPATAYLPMARNGEIENPRVLAERIRESLKRNPSGTSRVRGANIDSLGFLAAVKKAGGTVDGVHALPAYLDSLIGREMPEGVLTMSRVVYTRDTKGVEKFTLDIAKGHPRRAHKGERGWYDANTGYLILAGDCSNSPLAQVGLAPPPTPAPAIHRPAPVQQPPQQVMPLGRIPKLVCVTCPEKKKE